VPRYFSLHLLVRKRVRISVNVDFAPSSFPLSFSQTMSHRMPIITAEILPKVPILELLFVLSLAFRNYGIQLGLRQHCRRSYIPCDEVILLFHECHHMIERLISSEVEVPKDLYIRLPVKRHIWYVLLCDFCDWKVKCNG
jgi:hypothetical protein